MSKNLSAVIAAATAMLFAACASTPPATAEPAPGGITHAHRSGTCTDCGTVSTIEPIQTKGSASGAGAVIGAVIGGVVGHQFGQGKGQDAATVGGAIVGGVAGHEAEKRHNEGAAYYKVGVNMDNGYMRSVNVASAEGIGVGTRVRLVGNDLEVQSY